MLNVLRAASIAPVMAPLVMEFQGSSLPRKRTRPQSMVEKSPPHTAKLPAGETNHATIDSESLIYKMLKQFIQHSFLQHDKRTQ